PSDTLELRAAGGEHDHGRLAEVADPFEGLPAGEIRHRYVEDDEVRRRLVEGANAGAPVGGLLDGEPGSAEQLHDEGTDVRVVVDHEHPEFVHTSFIPAQDRLPYARCRHLPHGKDPDQRTTP